MEEDVVLQTQNLGSIDLIFDFLLHAQLNNSMDVVEIFKYERLTINFYDDFNILQRWELNRKQFLELRKLSFKILGAPASRVASERGFRQHVI